MPDIKTEAEWETLSHDEKNALMIRKQKELLNSLVERHAISREDYDKAMKALNKALNLEE